MTETPRQGHPYTIDGATVTLTYVRPSLPPRADGACVTVDDDDDRATGWYVEAENGRHPTIGRRFIPYPEERP